VRNDDRFLQEDFQTRDVKIEEDFLAKLQVHPDAWIVLYHTFPQALLRATGQTTDRGMSLLPFLWMESSLSR
jgi:hypothetical protein